MDWRRCFSQVWDLFFFSLGSFNEGLSSSEKKKTAARRRPVWFCDPVEEKSFLLFFLSVSSELIHHACIAVKKIQEKPLYETRSFVIKIQAQQGIFLQYACFKAHMIKI